LALYSRSVLYRYAGQRIKRVSVNKTLSVKIVHDRYQVVLGRDIIDVVCREALNFLLPTIMAGQSLRIPHAQQCLTVCLFRICNRSIGLRSRSRIIFLARIFTIQYKPQQDLELEQHNFSVSEPEPHQYDDAPLEQKPLKKYTFSFKIT
jgi:hypothetical protein